MRILDFFIECDPVVFDCWLVDKRTNKRLRKASVEEVKLWDALLCAEQKLNECVLDHHKPEVTDICGGDGGSLSA